jgi:hypothetical protein
MEVLETAADRGRMTRHSEIDLFGAKLPYHARC